MKLMTIKLIIPGEPIAKQRARVCRSGHAYTPEKTVRYETYIRELFAVQYPSFELLIGPIALKIWAYFPIPKGTSKRTRELMESGFVRRDKRPDYDNLAKAVSDALNGLAYGDDGQIASALIEKLYSGWPRLEIDIEEIKQ